MREGLIELSRERDVQREVIEGEEGLLQVCDVECEALEKGWEGGWGVTRLWARSGL